MRSKMIAAALVLSLFAHGGSACAMNTASNGSSDTAPRCTVGGPETIVASLGGRAAICAGMERALATVPAGAGAVVRVDIVTPNAAVARVTLDGRTLPEQRIDVSDRVLTPGSIEMLASAVADQLQKL